MLACGFLKSFCIWLKLIMLSRCLLVRDSFSLAVRSSASRFSSRGSFAGKCSNQYKDHDCLDNCHRFSVAPMMQYTDEYQRFFMRLISQRAVLYTEMVTAAALINNKNPECLLGSKFEARPPVVLQMGGSCPTLMKEAAEIAKRHGYLLSI